MYNLALINGSWKDRLTYLVDERLTPTISRRLIELAKAKRDNKFEIIGFLYGYSEEPNKDNTNWEIEIYLDRSGERISIGTRSADGKKQYEAQSFLKWLDENTKLDLAPPQD